MAKTDKPAALLTNTQREYLKGEESVSQSYERNLRDNIHDRIEATMGDFVTLFAELDQEDVQEAFGDNFATPIGVDEGKLEKALEGTDDPSNIDTEQVEEDFSDPRGTAANAPAAIAFLLRGLNSGNEPIYESFEDMGEEQPAFSQFIKVLELGVEMYLREEQNYTVNANLNIELEGLRPTDELLEE